MSRDENGCDASRDVDAGACRGNVRRADIFVSFYWHDPVMPSTASESYVRCKKNEPKMPAFVRARGSPKALPSRSAAAAVNRPPASIAVAEG